MTAHGVDWEALDSGRFEEVVGVLLSTLHPDSERIDGAGGDGGRDHQLRVDGRLELWQSKYFLKRLSESKTRKSQITGSLQTAAALQPDSWALVTPMDPNPEELAWFDGLRGQYPFELSWRGGVWLDARLAEHPSIVRHYMGANDKYVALIRELNEEKKALLDGFPDGRDRLEALARRMDEDNPFYALQITLDGPNVTSVGVRPKYRGAESDSPIRISFKVVLSEGSDDQALREAIAAAFDWGESIVIPAAKIEGVTVDAPHGLGQFHERAEIRLGPAESEPVHLPARLAVYDPAGIQVASLPVRLTGRVHGQRGVTLTGTDLTGAVTARVRVDTVEHRVTINLSFGQLPEATPGAILPVLRFMHHAVGPNTVTFGVGDLGNQERMTLPARDAIDDGFLVMIEDLERVQAASGEVFAVPEVMTSRDRMELARAVRLLDGERVALGAATPSTITFDDDTALKAFREAGTFQLGLTADEHDGHYVAEIAGHPVDLGPCHYVIPAARLADDQPDPGKAPNAVAIEPLGDQPLLVALGPLGAPASYA